MFSYRRDTIESVLKDARIKPRLIKDLRYASLEDVDTATYELFPLFDRSGNNGVLLTDNGPIQFTITAKIIDRASGRTKPITCDFCNTWQPGSAAAMITFRRARDNHTFTYLCCADLMCSLHARGVTSASKMSRTQLHEDISTQQRIERLQRKFSDKLAIIGQ